MAEVNVQATPESSPLERIGKEGRLSVRNLLMQMRAFVALILLFAYFAVSSDAFMTQSNQVILAKQVAINAILGIGMTFVILTGGIDLSVGSIVGLTGMVTGALIHNGLILSPLNRVVYFNAWIVALIALAVGTLVGLINGILVTRFRVAPFIATLGTLYMARGFAMLSNNGATFPNLVGKPELGNTGFPELGRGTLLGLPYSIWIMIGLTLLVIFITRKTPFGRQVYAIGGNQRAFAP